MPYMRSGTCNSLFVPKKRDLIPDDFFLELCNNVDNILLDDVGNVLIADATDAVFRKQSTGTQKPSASQRSPKGASKRGGSVKPSLWATHPSFNQPLFATDEKPSLAGGNRAPQDENLLPQALAPSSASPMRAGTAPLTTLKTADAQVVGVAPPSSPQPLAPSRTAPSAMQDESRRRSRSATDGRGSSRAARAFLDEEAENDEEHLTSILRDTKPPKPEAKDESRRRSQSATDARGTSRAARAFLDEEADDDEEPLTSSVLGLGSRRGLTEAVSPTTSKKRSASASALTESVAPTTSPLDNFGKAAGANTEALTGEPDIWDPAFVGTKHLGGPYFFEEDQAFGEKTLPPQQMLTRPPQHKYHFVSGDRFTDVSASSFAESLERLRQYLLMKYGSYSMAFRRMEETVDMTGLAGFREAQEGQHVGGMLHYREFTNAIKRLIPNWAEITGIGDLSKLWKAIDINGSGYISFEELLGCKMDDDMAHHTFDFCPRRPMQHCPFRKQFNPTPWSDNQNRTCSKSESFGSLKRFRNQEELMKELAPPFTPIWDMPIHHHEEDDGGSSMSSEAHSSDQEIDLDHIKLRLRAAGLAMKLNWRKIFQHYDQKHTMEIDWYEFRTIVRKEAQITPDILSERDLRLLFYSEDVVKEALGDSIFFEKLLVWLEPVPTEEEKAVMKQESKYMLKHAQTKHFHKTAFLRTLEVERRHVAADHHNHMSCGPCTKLCEICRGVILVSGWSAHKHGCARKQRMLVEKDNKEIEYLARWNFTPTISARARKTKATSTKYLHSGGKCPHRFPIRERKDREKVEEYQDSQIRECTFAPHINAQSRDIYRMVHEDQQDIGTRLANPTPHHRMTAKVESKMEADKEYTPQITVRGVQKGFERSGENVFHRLHHGPVDKATSVDPSTEKTEDDLVHHTTKNLMKCRKPLGISQKAWAKVKQTQQAESEDLIAKRRNEDLEREWGSPTSTGFPGDLQYGTPSHIDIFSPGAPNSLDGGAVPLESARSNAAASSVAAQPPYSARSAASSSATRATGLTTPGGGVGVFSGKLRASFDKRDSGKLSSSSTAFPLTSPLEEDDMNMRSALSSPELELGFPTHVVVGTSKVMSLLSRCEQAVTLAEKRAVLDDSSG